MSYEELKVVVGREPVTVVEIDLDKCANSYGVAPCTAAQATECYNTRNTCDDPDNYANTDTLTLYFSDRLIDGETHIPCINSTKLSPIEISPGQPFNKRASITITFNDFPHHDRGIDPYAATRSYTPEDQGTFFGKLVARNQYYQGRALRLRTGYISGTYSTSNFETQNYIIEKITGPDRNGLVTILAKDILKLADDERALCPAASTGDLVAAITDTDTALTVTSGTESEYSDESEYIRIGGEVINSPLANRSANVFSNLTRGAWNTTAESHNLGDSVQACKHFSSINVVDIFTDLLTNYAGISSSYIPTLEWTAEKNTWFLGHNLTALITKPTGVKTLTDELSEQIMIYMWWDSAEQLIRLKAIAPTGSISATLTDDDFVGDPIVSIKQEDRKSRVIVFYKPRTPIKFKDADDFDSLYGFIGADEESADQYNDIRAKEIYARWITSDSVANQTGSRTRNQFRAPPKIISFILDAGKTTAGETAYYGGAFYYGDGSVYDAGKAIGGFVNLSSRQIQDPDGSNKTISTQILKIEQLTKDLPGTHYKYTVQETQFAGRYGRIMSAGATSAYSSATDYEKETGGYIVAAGANRFSDLGEAYKIA